MACALCETRKEKRFCPGLHGRICAQCCGEEREVTIDCPSDCVYLRQARRFERPRELEQLDAAALFATIELSQQFTYEHEALITGLMFAIAEQARADHSIADRDAIAALSALAGRYQTLVSSGLHYEAKVAALPQQAIMAALDKRIAEYRDLEQKHLGYTALRDGDVLRALVFIVRMAHMRSNGRPKSRAFLDFMFQRFPEQKSAVISPNEASRIVMP